MINCELVFNLIGQTCSYFDILKALVPFAGATHRFVEDRYLVADHYTKANVIVVNMVGLMDIDLCEISREKDEKSELLLIADEKQIADKYLQLASDIFLVALDGDFVRYRVLSWYKNYRTRIELWESRHFLDSTINNSPNLIWFKTKDGVHEIVNDSFCEVVGKTKEQVQGQRHAYIWSVPEDDPVCIASEDDVMRSGERAEFQEIINVGSEKRELRVYKSPVVGYNGEVWGTVGVGIDVTNEQLYRKEVVSKSETLEKIFTSLDCGVIRHSIDGKHVLSINRAALEILGYDSQEEMMRDGFSLISSSVLDEDKIGLSKAIGGLKREGDSVSIEYRVKHKDGKIIYVLGDIKLLRDNNEFIYQRFLMDYTFQKLQGDKAEQHYSDMIQALSSGTELICFFDLAIGLGKIIRQDEELTERYGGIFDGDILFQSSMRYYIDKFVHPDDKETMREKLTLANLRVLQLDSKFHYIQYRVQIGDKIYYYQIKIVFVSGSDGGDGVVIGFECIDNMVRKEIERNAFLEDALERAKLANDSRLSFLANMSHDIRTPINAIVGYTSLALSHAQDVTKTEEYLQKIKLSSSHMLELLNNVLDLSSNESDILHIDESPISLSSLVKDTVTLSGQNASGSVGVTCSVNVTHDSVFCDSLRLKRVLTNLISNAVKYTKKGSISISVTESSVETLGMSSFIFTVSDTGVGMSESFMKKLFKPFSREYNTTESGVLGTGLGLVITKSLVDLMNGTISVKSVEGVGSTFKVTLELGYSEDILSDSITEKAKEEFRPSDYKILVVEDNELNQEILIELLSEFGFNSDLAENGKVAYEKVKAQNDFDMILMDIQMPVMNGYEATRLIRQDGFTLPIVAVSANAYDSDKQESVKSGMDAHIAKPVDMDVLYDVIMRYLLRA